MGSGQVVIRQKENKVLLPEHAVLEAGLTQRQDVRSGSLP